MKQSLFAIVFLVLITTVTYPTGQIPDKLIYNGKEYSLFCNPLESFFSDHSDKRPVSGTMSTALWRGYIATFVIRDGVLYVQDLEVESGSKLPNGEYKIVNKSVLLEVFPDSLERTCSFFSGLLVLPQGEILGYVHMGYSSVYANYTLIRVIDGKVQKERQFTGAEYLAFKKRQFQAYQQTDEYKKELTKLTKKR